MCSGSLRTRLFKLQRPAGLTALEIQCETRQQGAVFLEPEIVAALREHVGQPVHHVHLVNAQGIDKNRAVLLMGITQVELAGAVGVSRQSIISIEKGHYIPSLPLALKFARFFHCSTDELFQLMEEK